MTLVVRALLIFYPNTIIDMKEGRVQCIARISAIAFAILSFSQDFYYEEISDPSTVFLTGTKAARYLLLTVDDNGNQQLCP